LIEKHEVVDSAAQDMMIEEAPRTFLCELCSLSFYTKATLSSHKRYVHLKIRPFSCEQCGKSFKNSSLLKDHQDIKHAGITKYHCDKCATTFSTPENLKRHMKTQHSKKERLGYGCVECSWAYTVKHALKLHFLSEHGKALNNFKMVPMDKVQKKKLQTKLETKSVDALIRESLIKVEFPQLEGVRERCHTCDFHGSTKEDLNLHIRDHHDGQRYQCRECQHHFENREQLHQHYFSRHNKQVPIYGKIYSCNVVDCTHKTSTFGLITAHLIHKHNIKDGLQTYGERDRASKRHKCKICDYSGPGKTDLARHEATHTQTLDERKTLSCPHCDKKFSQPGHLGTHIRVIHLKVKTHRCIICDTWYSQSNNLIEHIAIKHMGFKDGKEWRKNKTRDLHLHARNHPAFEDATKNIAKVPELKNDKVQEIFIRETNAGAS